MPWPIPRPFNAAWTADGLIRSIAPRSGGSASCNFAAHVQAPFEEETAYCGKSVERNSPYCLTLEDGADVADLHSYVPCGMLSLKAVEGAAAQGGESAVLDGGVKRHVYGSEGGQGVDAFLYGLHL